MSKRTWSTPACDYGGRAPGVGEVVPISCGEDGRDVGGEEVRECDGMGW